MRQGTPRTALVFSAALGVFVAIFSTLALIKIATILVDNHERKQQVRHQMEAAKQLAALGASESEIKAALRPPPKPPRKKGWKRFLQVPKNPLAKPLRLFTIFVAKPLKRHYVNSVKAFVQAECLLRPVRGGVVVVEDKETSAPAPAPGEQLRSIPVWKSNCRVTSPRWRGGVGEHPTHWLLATQVHPRLVRWGEQPQRHAVRPELLRARELRMSL